MGGNRRFISLFFTGTLVAASAFVLGGEIAQAATCTRTWDGGASTSSASDAANWSPDGVPLSTDFLCVTDGSSVTLNLINDPAGFVAAGIDSNGTVIQAAGITADLRGPGASSISKLVLGTTTFAAVAPSAPIQLGDLETTAPVTYVGNTDLRGTFKLGHSVTFRFSEFRNWGTVDQRADTISTTEPGIGGTVRFINHGTWNLLNIGAASVPLNFLVPGIGGYAGDPFFNMSDGTFVRRGTGVAMLGVSNANQGVVRVESGDLLMHSVWNTVGDRNDHGGVFEVAAGSRLTMWGRQRFTHTTTPAVTGDGELRMAEGNGQTGTWLFDPGVVFDIARTEIHSGNGNALIGSPTFAATTEILDPTNNNRLDLQLKASEFAVGGTATVTVTPTGSLRIGQYVRFLNGTLNVLNKGRIEIANPVGFFDSCASIGGTVINEGTLAFSRTTASWWNSTAGTVHLLDGCSGLTGVGIGSQGSGIKRLINRGVVENLTTAEIWMNATNLAQGSGGIIRANTGQILYRGVNEGYNTSTDTLTGGIYEAASGAVVAPITDTTTLVGAVGASPVSVNDATLVYHGTGRIVRNIDVAAPDFVAEGPSLFEGAASVTNQRTIRLLDNANLVLPASTPFTQATSGALDVSIGSKLTVQGAASFAGALLVSGSGPAPGTPVTLVEYSSSAGFFTSVTTPPPPGGYRYEVQYLPTRAVLVAVALEPDTSIDAGPDSPTNANSASFTFSSDNPSATFECRLDSADFTPCTSPTTYTDLSATTHTFEARAVANSAADATPASYTWTIEAVDPPTIEVAVTGTPGTNGWYTSNVTVDWTVTAPGDPGAVSVVGCLDQSITTDQTATSYPCEVTSQGGYAGPESISVKRDATKPTTQVVGVTAGASYAVGSVPPASCSAVDATSGVATNATVSVVEGPSGTFTATCAGAVDYAGNVGNPASITYTVSSQFPWSGFLQPVDNLPTTNTAKAGSSIPVKFSLSGNRGLSIFAVGSPSSVGVSCGTTAAEDSIETVVTATNSGLSYDAAIDRYTYIWKTDRSWSQTCRTLTLKFVDGSVHQANFRFTR